MSADRQTGGCHCGAVGFDVLINLESHSIRCNCSICTKSRAWISPVPAADFTLTRGAEAITEYRFGAEHITHCFCRHCGLKTHGRIKGESGAYELVAVSVQCIDLAPSALDAVPISVIDGAADRHDRAPAIAGYL